MLKVGFLLLCGCVGVVIRVERLEGFTHFFDLDWIRSDRARSRVISGRTALQFKVAARIGVVVALAMIVIGALGA